MAGVPYFRITDCCTGNDIIVNFNTAGIPPTAADDGIYKWNTADFIVAIGFTLIQDNCYIIQSLGAVLNLYDDVNYDDFVLEALGETNCQDVPGCDCESTSPGGFYIKAEPCCGGDPIFFNGESYNGGLNDNREPVTGEYQGSGTLAPSIPEFNVIAYTGVYLFNGFLAPVSNNAGLVVGQCYTFTNSSITSDGAEITSLEGLPYPPLINSELTQVSKNNCDQLDEFDQRICPDCNPVCYRLTSCTGITIDTIVDFSAYVGTYVELFGYTGSWFVQINDGICRNPSEILRISNTSADPCPCICYEVVGNSGAIQYIDCDGVSQITYGPAKFCAQAEPFIKGIEGEDFTLLVGTDCVDGECVPECFYLRNCEPERYPTQDPIIFSNLQSLSQYAGTSSVVQIANFEGCWQVFNAECTCINLTIQIGGDLPRQYQAGLVYFDSNDNAVYSFDLIFDNGGVIEQYVYYLWYSTVDLQWYITQTVGDTSNPLAQTDLKVAQPCPAPIVEDWVPLNGPDGESIVQLVTSALCEDQCVCPIDVTVITDFESCVSCLPTRAYKLTSCSNPLINTYTTQDLAQYVDKVVKDDCDCYTVQEIDYQPPINTPITIDQAYDDCETCQAEFFILTDCNDSENTVITNTDLTVYLGQYIKIKNCSFCFFVESYTDVPEFVEEVTVEENFTTCFDCNQVPPRCSTVFNNSTEDRTFTFINANGDPEETDIVKSGHFSLRYCVQTWEEDDSFIYNFYGDCTVYEDESGTKTGFCVQYFPNNRKVKPGYNTPICSADKYDKITCNFADIAYKKVLELRYGISNCCPEEDEKWLIKKELIELQALTDPDYTCDPLTDCCGKQTSHCSCNS